MEELDGQMNDLQLHATGRDHNIDTVKQLINDMAEIIYWREEQTIRKQRNRSDCQCDDL
jgi:hypothetical protein